MKRPNRVYFVRLNYFSLGENPVRSGLTVNHNYFKPAKLIFRVSILESASASFCFSKATTCSGAPLTKRSFFSLPCTLLKKPSVYFNSSESLTISSSTFIAPAIGMKYSLLFTRKVSAPSNFSEI